MDRDKQGKFTPGHSGVGGGRKKGSLSLTDEIKRQLAKVDEKTKKRNIEILAVNILQGALAGDTRLMIELWNMIDGKPRQALDVGGDNAVKIEIEHIRIADASDVIDNKPKS